MFKKVFAFLCLIIVIVLFIPAFMLFTSKTVTSASGDAQKEAPDALPDASEEAKTTLKQIYPFDKTKPITPVEVVKTTDASEYYYSLTKSPKYEMRGVWVATVLNIDMPSGMDEAAFRKWANETCQNARDRNQNTIIFQVKPTADALYKSELAPWSMYISGESQKDPGYDPLAIMLEQAHSLGIELHAWINPYRITMASQKLSALSPDSAAVKNPSWVIGYNNQFYFNPGLPEVRKYLVDCVAEIVQNYDVDAIHMDDYFYPYPSSGIPFPDDDAYKKYGAGFDSVDAWRRSNVNTLVADINRKIKEIKPHVQYGISPFGVWRNIANDPTGSETKAGIQNYDSLYADTRQWLKDGSIDYLAPQVYWARTSAAANYSVLINWWNNEVLKYTSKEHGGEGVHPVNLYIGMADYKVGTNNDVSWEKTNTEITGQISDNRQKDAITGQIHYNYSTVIENPMEYFDLVRSNNYSSMALTPPCPWNGLEQAELPEAVDAELTADGIRVKISSGEGRENTRKYVIYRFDAQVNKQYTNENMIAVVYNNGITEFLDENIVKSGRYVYSVRAVSNTGIESEDAVDSKVMQF